MRPVPLLALALAGCGAGAADLERDIAALRDEVQALETSTSQMRQALAKARAAVERPATAELPDGFDVAAPLPEGGRQPDVILLSIDTLRADHLGAYGYARDTSPFLDALAAEGTRFSNAWSPSPWTLPSHTTMLTGLLPQNHGVIEDHVAISESLPLVQEFFREAGYGTGAAVATLFVSSRFGFDRGFDYFHDFGIKGAKANNASTVDAEHVFAHALDWAQEQPDGKPLFLFLHVYDAHYAYNAPPPFNERFDRPARIGDAVYTSYHAYARKPLSDEQMAHQVAQYDEEIAYVDHAFRQLVEKWRAERPHVIVAVTADHGEEFGERGSWGHAHTLYPEQLHVPWIVAGPGIRSQVVDDRVGTEDIAVTLASMAGVPFVSPDGVDRSAQLRSGARPRQDHVSAALGETSRFQSLQYRWHAPPWDLYVDLVKGRTELCDLSSDPRCERNLWDDEQARGEAMVRALADFLGQPWEARAEGVVQVQGGQLYVGTEKVKRGRLEVKPGDRFAAFPADAHVRFVPAGSRPADAIGPWRAVGGDLPGDDAPLAYHGPRFDAASIELSDAEKEMLQALGYIQE